MLQWFYKMIPVGHFNQVLLPLTQPEASVTHSLTLVHTTFFLFPFRIPLEPHLRSGEHLLKLGEDTSFLSLHTWPGTWPRWLRCESGALWIFTLVKTGLPIPCQPEMSTSRDSRCDGAPDTENTGLWTLKGAASTVDIVPTWVARSTPQQFPQKLRLLKYRNSSNSICTSSFNCMSLKRGRGRVPLYSSTASQLRSQRAGGAGKNDLWKDNFHS